MLTERSEDIAHAVDDRLLRFGERRWRSIHLKTAAPLCLDGGLMNGREVSALDQRANACKCSRACCRGEGSRLAGAL